MACFSKDMVGGANMCGYVALLMHAARARMACVCGNRWRARMARACMYALACTHGTCMHVCVRGTLSRARMVRVDIHVRARMAWHDAHCCVIV